MRSTLHRAVDISAIELPPFEPHDVAREADAALEKLLRRGARTVLHEHVEDGDLVEVRLDGASTAEDAPAATDTGTAARRTTIVVGRGLFDPAVETSMLGATVGQSLATNGAHDSERLEVLAISARVLPERSDAVVAALSDGTHATVADLLAAETDRVLNTQAEDYRNDHFWTVMSAVTEEAEATVDPADVEVLVSKEVERCRRLSREEGLVFEEMTSEQLSARVGRPDMASFMEMLRDICHDLAIRILHGAAILEEDPADVDASDANRELDALTSAINERVDAAIADGRSLAGARRA